jgi:uncharacterized protein with PIN domain
VSVVSVVIRLEVASRLRLFLAPRHRGGEVSVHHDGTASLGHLVESLGPPLTEVGALVVAGRAVPPGYRPRPGDVVRVEPVHRPQPVPVSPARFLLDVHLGTLARRLRLLGVDTAYRPQAEDADLVARSAAERRVLLTQDRGLLRRRAVWCGGYVYGARPDDQLADVLDRFAPPLSPWIRCTACNGLLEPAPKRAVEHLLEPGTRRSYDAFARCRSCGRPYWRGAHAGRLQRLVADSEQQTRRRAAGIAGGGPGYG